MIIGFAGAAGAGKDTAALALINEMGYRKASFASAIKVILSMVFQWKLENWENLEWKETPNKNCYGLTPRYMAQTLGTEWGRRMVNENVWVDLQAGLHREAMAEGNYVYTDVRFPNEAAMIRAEGGILIFVSCVDRETGTTSNDHESEQHLEWLHSYADCEIAADFGKVDALQEAVLNVVENYTSGNVPRYEPSADAMRDMNDLETIGETQHGD